MGRGKELVEAEVEIEGFSSKGHGIGTYQREGGQPSPIEVPFTVPGDRARVKVLRRRKGVHGSLLEQIVEPSPVRIEPQCAHFGACGGCKWQQLPYEQQLEEKQRRVNALFADLLHEDVDVSPIVPCDPPWQYRNKMDFSFSSSREGVPYLGLVVNGGRGRAMNTKECHLCADWQMEVLERVRAWWLASELEAYFPPRDHGSLRSLTIREGQRTGDRMVILQVSGRPEFALNRHQLETFADAVRPVLQNSRPGSRHGIFVRIQQTAKGMPTNFYELHLEGTAHVREQLYLKTGEGEAKALQFSISPTAFFQPNTRQAERLYSTALEMANIGAEDLVFDLYCGTGTLGICAGLTARQVVGIELSPEAVLDANDNVRHNQLDNVSVICGDVGRELERLQREEPGMRPDVVMVDPPRAGLSTEAIACLASLKANRLVYVSCNPKTQATDVAALVEAGYQLKAMRAVDQFPHTIHIENVALLTRGDADE